MDEVKIHIEKDVYQATIQNTNKEDIRITIAKDKYVIISMFFANGTVKRERDFETNGVKVPEEAIKMLKQSSDLLKSMFPSFQFFEMDELETYIN